MTFENDGFELTSRPEPGVYSKDPRNPGSAGMPGANPGFGDPGQRQTERSHEDRHNGETATPPAAENRRLESTIEVESNPEKPERDALDRWSLDGGSS